LRLLNKPGDVFGKLTIVSAAPDIFKYKKRWLCNCSCGQNSIVYQMHLRSGRTTSCGCSAGSITHGDTGSIEYFTWLSMSARCNNPKHKAYIHYGARGITVCDRWKDYTNFLADMGRRPAGNYSLDRIDNDGNYTPSNCRWATKWEQARNKRPRIAIQTYKGNEDA
jgi:hypothetical protein